MKVVNDAKGGTVYRDHLPLLGEQGPGRSGLHGFAIGDQVTETADCLWHFISIFNDVSFYLAGERRLRFGIGPNFTTWSRRLD